MQRTRGTWPVPPQPMQSRRLVRKPAFLRMTPSPPQRVQPTSPALPPSAPVPLHAAQSSGRSNTTTFSQPSAASSKSSSSV